MDIKSPAIDSLKLWLPVNWLEFTDKGRILFDKRFVLKRLVEKLTGDKAEDVLGGLAEKDLEMIDRMFKSSEAFDIEDNGIKIKIKVVRIGSSFNRSMIGEFLLILLTSKVLKNKYFQGITKETIRDVYEYLMNLGLFKVSFEDFLKAFCTDIDIKFDIHGVDEDQARVFLKRLLYFKDDLQSSFRKDNLMVQFESRYRTFNYKRFPFVKIYHKGLELLNSSVDFYNAFLSDQDVSEILRVEGTLKNKNHLKSFKLYKNELAYLLENLTAEKIKSILASFFKKYLTVKSEVVNLAGLKPIELTVYLLVESKIQSGYTLNRILDEYVSKLGDYMSKPTLRKYKGMIKDLYWLALENKNLKGKVKENEEFEKFIFILLNP